MIPKQTNALIKIGIGILLLGFSIFGLVTTYSSVEAKSAKANEIKKVDVDQEAQMVSSPRTIMVILQREYVDGEVSEEVIEEKILSMEDFWATYETWQLVDKNVNFITFRKHIDDISPLLKVNGYFGISEDGTLSIFKGKPNSDNVIQSFFQIDMDKLESRQHDELKDGIPIKSKDHYKQVLEDFKNFSLQ